jgi:hypothetical protein
VKWGSLKILTFFTFKLWIWKKLVLIEV